MRQFVLDYPAPLPMVIAAAKAAHEHATPRGIVRHQIANGRQYIIAHPPEKQRAPVILPREAASC